MYELQYVLLFHTSLTSAILRLGFPGCNPRPPIEKRPKVTFVEIYLEFYFSSIHWLKNAKNSHDNYDFRKVFMKVKESHLLQISSCLRTVLPIRLSTFFDSPHPSLVIKQFGGTPSFNLLANRHPDQNLAASLEFFGAPRLRTTALHY